MQANSHIEQRKLISFGVIADVQYGDVESYGAMHPRTALHRLRTCVDDFNGRELAFVVQLGDIIEGRAKRQQTHEDLDRILSVFGQLQMPAYHVLGNHDVAHAGRERMQSMPGLTRAYYAFSNPAAGGWRFIVLDGNEGEPGYEGVLGDVQLAWLAGELAQASAREKKVIVFCHYALLEAAAAKDRMYAPEPVLRLIEDCGCVVAYFAGHEHRGGYAHQNGIHHVTLKGMVEAWQRNAYAVIDLYPDRLEIVGCGEEPCRTCHLVPSPAHCKWS